MIVQQTTDECGELWTCESASRHGCDHGGLNPRSVHLSNEIQMAVFLRRELLNGTTKNPVRLCSPLELLGGIMLRSSHRPRGQRKPLGMKFDEIISVEQ